MVRLCLFACYCSFLFVLVSIHNCKTIRLSLPLKFFAFPYCDLAVAHTYCQCRLFNGDGGWPDRGDKQQDRVKTIRWNPLVFRALALFLDTSRPLCCKRFAWRFFCLVRCLVSTARDPDLQLCRPGSELN